MAVYKQIGTMACYSCGERVPVKENENGGLSFPCPWCDFPAYAKAGTQAVKIARQRMAQMPQESATDEPKPGDAPPAEPTKGKKQTVFG